MSEGLRSIYGMGGKVQPTLLTADIGHDTLKSAYRSLDWHLQVGYL